MIPTESSSHAFDMIKLLRDRPCRFVIHHEKDFDGRHPPFCFLDQAEKRANCGLENDMGIWLKTRAHAQKSLAKCQEQDVERNDVNMLSQRPFHTMSIL